MRRRDKLTGFNERVKLRAMTANAVGLAVLAVGVLRPLMSSTVEPTWGIAFYILIAVALHVLANYIVSQVEIET